MTEENNVTEMICKELLFVRNMMYGEMKDKWVRLAYIKIEMRSKKVCGID